MKYFLDTNIVSYLIRHNKNILENLKQLILEPSSEICISTVTYYELKRGLLATSAASKLLSLQSLLLNFNVYNMTLSTYDIAAEEYAYLKNSGNIVEDADIFIASTVIEHEATIVTNNKKHFSRCNSINILEWKI